MDPLPGGVGSIHPAVILRCRAKTISHSSDLMVYIANSNYSHSVNCSVLWLVQTCSCSGLLAIVPQNHTIPKTINTIAYIPSKYLNVAVPLVRIQLVAATSIVCLALYGRVSVVSLICEVVVIMLVPLMV